MRLMLDDYEFTMKPKGGEVGKINNRIIKCEVNIDIKDLANEITKGKTFVPATFKSIDSQIKRSLSHWESQEIIALDFDEGLLLQDALANTFFKENAAFLYTTFSHSEEKHKFRVVFALSKRIENYEVYEKVIDDLLVRYPSADKACRDGTRLFFGGRKLYEFDYSNRLSIFDYIEDTHWGDIQGCYSNISPQRVALNPAKDARSNPKFAQHIDLIRDKRFLELRELIGIKPISLRKSEIDGYLKKQDLRKLLGIYSKGSFYDIFHDEKSPSASIFQSHEKNGHWLYKCHSSDHEFIGNIFEVLKRLNAFSTFAEARLYLVELFQIEIITNAVEDELIGRLHQYKALFDSEKAIKRYPYIFKVLNRCKLMEDIQVVLNLAIEQVGNYEGRALFFPSIKTLSKLFNKGKSVAGRQMNLLVLFKLVNKVPQKDLPKVLFSQQKKHQVSKKYTYMSSTYEIPRYSEMLFKGIEKMCRLWIENGCTTKTLSYEGIHRTFGKKEADRIFLQYDEKRNNELSSEITTRIQGTAMRFIQWKGWTTEKEILDEIKLYFKGQKEFKKVQFKRCISEMIEMYDLELIPTNKQIKQVMNITENDMPKSSFPKIFRAVSVETNVVNETNILLRGQEEKMRTNKIMNYMKNGSGVFAPVFSIHTESNSKAAANYVFSNAVKAVKNKWDGKEVATITTVLCEFRVAFKRSAKSEQAIEQGIEQCVALGLFKINDSSKKRFVLTDKCFDESLVS